jgi:hypothetical protein
MRMTSRLPAFFAVSFVLCSACSGAAPSDLLGPGASLDGGGGNEASSSNEGGGHEGGGEAGVDPGINCPGIGTCYVPAQVCCKGDTSFVCAPAGGCGGISIPCDDTADCTAAGHAGTVCCLTGATTGVPPSVACMPPSACVGSQGRTPICDPNVPTCPTGQSCQLSQTTLPGFNICK